MLALELLAVSKRYGTRRALAGVNLEVPAGSAIGLLGPNGAGKTTTLRLLLGFTRPDEGSVRLRGLDPSDPTSRIGVGYLPERLALPGRMTVRGFLRLHGALAGLGEGDLDRETDAVLRHAQAFLGRPELLLLDEPTSGLDPIGVRDARDWIGSARERGCTVLVSSHILSEVERICDRVAIMHEGRIAASGPIDQLVRPGEGLEDAFVRVVRG
jgi:ABC-2 type transport system ATP-binding protein